MVGMNADNVFSQIVTIAKSNASELERCQRAIGRIDQFEADVARSAHRRETTAKHKSRLREMLRIAATGRALSTEERAVFLAAHEGLSREASVLAEEQIRWKSPA